MSAYRETTWGALMDYANEHDDTVSKDFLRKCFQGWCKANGRTPMNPQTVLDWRNEKVTLDVGDTMPHIAGE